jgi:hypothetical protein
MTLIFLTPEGGNGRIKGFLYYKIEMWDSSANYLVESNTIG